MAVTDIDRAKELFFLNFSQKKISGIMKITEQTISKWAKEGDWAALRSENITKKESIENRVLKLIDYQLEVLEHEISQGRKSDKFVAIDKGAIDALSKLFASIKAKEISFAAKVKLLTDFTDFIHHKDQAAAKRILVFVNEYIYKLKDDLKN